MGWEVEYTDEFGAWFVGLTEGVQDDIDRSVGLLEAKGPQLPFPYSSGVQASRHDHMRELRIQSGGAPYRIFYAFDPRRTAILLIGGNKAEDDRFYETTLRMPTTCTTPISPKFARKASFHDGTPPIPKPARRHVPGASRQERDGDEVDVAGTGAA